MPGFDNDVMYAGNVDFSGSTSVQGRVTSDGQMLIGSSVAPNIRVATISNGNNLSWTFGNGTAQANLSGTTNNAIQVGNSSGSLSSISSVANAILLTNSSGVPSLGNTLTGDFTFTSSTAAVTRSVTVSNSDNTSGSSAALFIASTGGTSSGDAYFRCAVGTARSYSMGIDTSDTQAFKLTTAANGTVGPSAASILTRVDTSGNRTHPLNACCSVDLNTGLTNATGDGTFIAPLIFDRESSPFFDQNSNYDTGTGLFTAPVTGRYLVTARVTLNGIGAGHTAGVIRIDVSGTAFFISNFNPAATATSGEVTIPISGIIPASATNTIGITIQVSGSTKTVGVKGQNFGSWTSLSVVLVS